jgi:hypothetical protein
MAGPSHSLTPTTGLRSTFFVYFSLSVLIQGLPFSIFFFSSFVCFFPSVFASFFSCLYSFPLLSLVLFLCSCLSSLSLLYLSLTSLFIYSVRVLCSPPQLPSGRDCKVPTLCQDLGWQSQCFVQELSRLIPLGGTSHQVHTLLWHYNTWKLCRAILVRICNSVLVCRWRSPPLALSTWLHTRTQGPSIGGYWFIAVQSVTSGFQTLQGIYRGLLRTIHSQHLDCCLQDYDAVYSSCTWLPTIRRNLWTPKSIRAYAACL